jgi:predicted RNase H-like HicB family nuclease
MQNRYHINLFWSDEDACWIADVPDLKFCSAHGDAPEEALAEVMVAMQAWLESARKHGDPIPEPRYQPTIYAASPAA